MTKNIRESHTSLKTNTRIDREHVHVQLHVSAEYKNETLNNITV